VGIQGMKWRCRECKKEYKFPNEAAAVACCEKSRLKRSGVGELHQLYTQGARLWV
jgi:hypothetical protein